MEDLEDLQNRLHQAQALGDTILSVAISPGLGGGLRRL
jgi:hypothetical protein